MRKSLFICEQICGWRENGNATPRVQCEQISVAADQHIGVARQNQCQKRVVFGIAPGGDPTGFMRGR